MNNLPYGTFRIVGNKLVEEKKPNIIYKGITIKPENPMYEVISYYAIKNDK